MTYHEPLTVEEAEKRYAASGELEADAIAALDAAADIPADLIEVVVNWYLNTDTYDDAITELMERNR